MGPKKKSRMTLEVLERILELKNSASAFLPNLTIFSRNGIEVVLVGFESGKICFLVFSSRFFASQNVSSYNVKSSKEVFCLSTHFFHTGL